MKKRERLYVITEHRCSETYYSVRATSKREALDTWRNTTDWSELDTDICRGTHRDPAPEVALDPNQEGRPEKPEQGAAP